MKTIEEISQWVIDNRYPKSENDKVSDFEMYQTLIEAMNQVLRQPPVSGRSEQFVCGANKVMGEKRCERQCGQCEQLYPQTNCH